MQDLKDTTSDVLYENYRTNYLAKMNTRTEYVFHYFYFSPLTEPPLLTDLKFDFTNIK